MNKTDSNRLVFIAAALLVCTVPPFAVLQAPGWFLPLFVCLSVLLVMTGFSWAARPDTRNAMKSAALFLAASFLATMGILHSALQLQDEPHGFLQDKFHVLFVSAFCLVLIPDMLIAVLVKKLNRGLSARRMALVVAVFAVAQLEVVSLIVFATLPTPPAAAGDI